MRPDLPAANASPHYTEASLETAACLWEAVLNLRDHPRTDPDAIGLALMIRKTCDAIGTASLRMTVIGWTDAVEADWRAVEQDYPLCFDWDFVPSWVIDHVDWSDPMLPTVTSRGGGMDLAEAGELSSAVQEPQP